MSFKDKIRVADFYYRVSKIKESPDIQKMSNSCQQQDYPTNLHHLELNITVDCNLKCPQCISSCSQAPSKEYLSVEYIDKLVEDFIEAKWIWKMLALYGGEPTLHPYFMEVIKSLEKYKEFYPKCEIWIKTNGIGAEVKKQLELLPEWVIVENSGILGYDKKIATFRDFNMAPIDLPEYKDFTDEQFGMGCYNTQRCGMGVFYNGYFACSPGLHIDRVMKLGIGMKSLKDITPQNCKKQLSRLCKYCGIFKFPFNFTTEPIMTKTWKEAYRKYAKDSDKKNK